MTNPKHEILSSKQIRGPESELLAGTRSLGRKLDGCLGETSLPKSFRGMDAWPHASGGAETSAKCSYHEDTPMQSVQPLSADFNHSATKATHSKTCRTVGTPVCNRLYGLPAGLLVNCLKVGAPLCWLFCFFILHSSFCLRASGQSYSIDWWTVDGGGGTSTGGVFAVSGTIGQPDAGTMTGGGFVLQGGFWGVVAAVQTPGAPYLSVFRTTTNTVVVSWPLADAEGWTLQCTTNLVSGGSVWANIPPPYQTNGANLQYIEPAPLGNRFYRLYKP